MKLDLSRMFEPKCAVNCSTPDQADYLLACLREQHPDKMKPWNYGTEWDVNKEDTCYTFFRSADNNIPYEHLMFERKSIMRHYIVIPFDDLLPEDDIQSSECSLEFLLGV